MKRLLIFFLLVSQVALGETIWTVRTVPNTRLQGNEIHVSDPDGYLSDSAEMAINRALDSIRDRADVFVVTLTSIGDAETKHFATELFNYWGIGDKETDNGVLLLFVEDQHALEFETGYGAEGTLTDADCSMIFNNTIVPYFMDGDYEAGLCAGVIDIGEVFDGAVPMGLKSFVPDMDSSSEESFGDSMSYLGVFFILVFLLPIPFISFFRWLVDLVNRKKNKKDGEEEDLDVFTKDGLKYINYSKSNWNSSVWRGKGFLRFLVYGVLLVGLYVLAVFFIPRLIPEKDAESQDALATLATIIVYLTVTCVIQNVMLLKKADRKASESNMPRGIYDKALKDAHSVLSRIMAPWIGFLFGTALRKRKKNSARFYCPDCGQAMMEDDSVPLPGVRHVEQELGAYTYSPCRCASGHVYVLRTRGSHFDNIKTCESCGAHAMKVVEEKVITAASYSAAGQKEVTYVCQCCNKKSVVTKTIPKLVYSSGSSSSGSRSYTSSRSHSSGSFGGGRSGGGGYSGRW